MTTQVLDPYAHSANLDAPTLALLAERLETRAREPRQRALRRTFLSRLPRRNDMAVLEVGCGTGVVSREIGVLPGISSVVGIDTSPYLVERARLTTDDARIRFDTGDAVDLTFADATFDAVVFATTLCHVPDARRALTEAHRVLRPGGTLLVFDGDYVTTSVAIAPDDPLQACVDAAIARIVHHRWLVRRLSKLAGEAGFRDIDLESHGYVEIADPSYTPTFVDLGANALVADGVIGAETAAALRDEARRRALDGSFFAHIAYASVVASAPDKS